MLKKLWGGFLVGLGYLLSPLSWWNDLVFNFPIAYAFGYGVHLLVPHWLLPATIVGYWLSNVLGLLLMQVGTGDVLWGDRPTNPKKDWLISLGTSTLYTVVVVVLLQLHWLETPAFLTALSP